MPAYHYQTPTNDKEGSRHDVTGHLMPARAFFFAIVDEPGKDGFLVRKIYAAPDNLFLRDMGLSPLQQLQELHPERYGLSPKNFEAGTSVAEHVMGNNMSSYVSTSELFPGGSPRFEGRSIVIDIAKAKRAGAKLVETGEILTALEQYKAENPHLAKRVSKIAGYVKDIDKEVLVQSPKVPASAIFNERSLRTALGFTKYARVVQIFGIVFTAYDLDVATEQSVQTKSIRPIRREAVKQMGGWGGATAGARIGAALGASIGVETGPGAIITGAIGGLLLGAVGYFGADWLNQKFDPL